MFPDLVITVWLLRSWRFKLFVVLYYLSHWVHFNVPLWTSDMWLVREILLRNSFEHFSHFVPVPTTVWFSICCLKLCLFLNSILHRLQVARVGLPFLYVGDVSNCWDKRKICHNIRILLILHGLASYDQLIIEDYFCQTQLLTLFTCNPIIFFMLLHMFFKYTQSL